MGKFELELKECKFIKYEVSGKEEVSEDYLYQGDDDYISMYINSDYVDCEYGDITIDVRIKNRSDGEVLKNKIMDFVFNLGN